MIFFCNHSTSYITDQHNTTKWDIYLNGAESSGAYSRNGWGNANHSIQL